MSNPDIHGDKIVFTYELEKAIEFLMKKIRQEPFDFPKKPDYPIK